LEIEKERKMPGMDRTGPFGNGRFGRGLGPCGGGHTRRGGGYGWRALSDSDIDVKESLELRKSWLKEQLTDINNSLQNLKSKEKKESE